MLQKNKPSHQGYPGYNTKLHVIGRLQFWECGVTPSLLLHSGPLWPVVVVPIRVPSMGQIDVCKLFVLRLLDIIFRNFTVFINCAPSVFIVGRLVGTSFLTVFTYMTASSSSNCSSNNLIFMLTTFVYNGRNCVSALKTKWSEIFW